MSGTIQEEGAEFESGRCEDIGEGASVFPQDLKKLLVPVIVEQLLTSLMGTADTMMVSNVGPAAISAVSLVDAINILVIQAFSALTAGGAIICAHYIGSKKYKSGELFRAPAGC